MGTSQGMMQGVFPASSSMLFLVGSRSQQYGQATIICGHCGRGQFNRGQTACIACRSTLMIPLEPLHHSDAPIAPEDYKRRNPCACLRLKRLRRLLEISQPVLAAAAGCPRTYVTKYEHGRVQPSLDSFDRLAAAMGITLKELLDESFTLADLAMLSLSRSGELMRELISSLPRLRTPARIMILATAIKM